MSDDQAPTPTAQGDLFGYDARLDAYLEAEERAAVTFLAQLRRNEQIKAKLGELADLALEEAKELGAIAFPIVVGAVSTALAAEVGRRVQGKLGSFGPLA